MHNKEKRGYDVCQTKRYRLTKTLKHHQQKNEVQILNDR